MLLFFFCNLFIFSTYACSSSSSWLYFANEDLGALSTSDAGSFMAEESYAGRQTQPQRLQGKDDAGVGTAATRVFLLLHFSSRVALRMRLTGVRCDAKPLCQQQGLTTAVAC